MAIEVQGRTGPVVLADGALATLQLGRQGGLMNSQLHGKYYISNFRGNVFSGGMTVQSINNATFTTGTLGATATPIVGVWNPANSSVNLVILQAMLAVTITALQNTGCGGFMWCTSVGNAAISTGAAPLNRKSLTAIGSQAKDMSGAALTGLTTNLATRSASSLMGGSSKALATLDTAAGASTTMTGCAIEMIDGAWIVPPGGILALLCTGTPVAHNAGSGIVWEEVPL